jgi:hypothetical protein
MDGAKPLIALVSFGISSKKRDVDAVAKTVNRQQMNLLNARYSLMRHADMNITIGQDTSERSAAIAGQRYNAHIPLLRRFDRRHHIT